MNERIRELANRAGYNDQIYNISKEGFDKFAELIVSECVGVAIEQRDWVENMVVFNDRDAFWNKAKIVQSQRIIDKIKEHFGVE